MAQSAFKISSEGLYNTSMSLARHVLRTPSRILARMRSLDAVLDYTPSPSASGSSAMHSDPNVRTQRPQDVGIPGPWGFLTSGYFFGLFFMAFILNRVQNIVVPPRQPPAFQQYLRATAAGQRHNPMQSIFRAVFPMDLSSTRSRFIFRIPSIFFLIRSLVLWFLILAQGADTFSLPHNTIPKSLYSWAADMPMEDVCWSTFFAVCFALFVSSLTSGMEGLYTSSNSPFNLRNKFGYSFTLYIYGSPMTHTYRPKGAASRPDVHVLFTMIIPLLQLTMTHCLEVKQLWAKQRLIPTTICSLLSLSHFHLVMWFFPASYPLPTMVPNVVESFLLLVTATTCALNALTQLLLNGAITKPLFGHAETLKPKWDEDFSVVLFRLGTASLEATSVAGYGNEVGGITRPRGDLVLSQTPAATSETTVEISRSGLVSVVTGADALGRRSGHKRGFTNEIRHVKASSGNTEVWADTLVNVAWHREMARFLFGLWRTMSGLGRMLWAFIRGRPRQLANFTLAADSNDLRDDPETQGEIAADKDVYERFLRGEDLGDEDDDAEYEPQLRQATFASTSAVGATNGEDDDASSEEDEDDREDNGEAVELYTDLSQTASTSASAPLLLAHMTNTSSSPLTRRRYANLIRIPDANSIGSSDEWSRFVEERRMSKRGRIQDEAALESRQTCVICTVEPREIVCWPCRCLALCDDCRENLASRSSASKHLCPCCRANVEGYSKIYIP